METDKKEKRRERKRSKLLAEYELSKSNDEVKRPGELLDAPTAKKVNVDSNPEAGRHLPLSAEDFKEVKKQLKERKKFLTQLPRFHLQFAGSLASLAVDHDTRVPVLMTDIQQLLLYAVGGNIVSYPPERWCYLQKYNRLTNIIAVVLEGLSCQDFFTYEHLFPKLTSIFQDRVEVFSPSHYGNEVAEEMACVPISNIQKQSILAEYGTIEAALSSKQVFKVFRALFPINFKAMEEIEEDEQHLLSTPAPLLPPGDMFPRTYLLLSLQQMMVEGFPLPFEHDMRNSFSDFTMTKRSYKEVSVCSPIFAVDCEMCKTGKEVQELTRIAIINEDLETVYSTLVKPRNRITDYLTKYSGITKEMLEDVTTTLEDVHAAIQRILPDDAILVGHSLNCDLKAMKMIHPYVIDTSVSFNVSGVRNRKSKLAFLAEHFLKDQIQRGDDGHCPEEDAGACMKLIKLKLSKGYQFGDELTAQNDDSRKDTKYQLTASIFNQTEKAKKSVSVIAPENILQTYKDYAVGIKPSTFKPICVARTKDAFKKLEEVSLNSNMVITHVDITNKLEALSEDQGRVDKLMSKVDKWCENIFKVVSRNGLFVLLFAGVKPPTGSKLNDSDSDKDLKSDSFDPPPKKKKKSDKTPSPSNQSDSEMDKTSSPKDENQNSSSSSNSKPNSQIANPRQRSRRNGVCFVRINTATEPKK